jgi:plasmid maintenance system killer protein
MEEFLKFNDEIIKKII